MVRSRARDALVVYSADMTSALAGFVSLILVSRELGPSGFGVFSIAMAIMGIAFQISDFGLSSGTVKLASPLYSKDPGKFRQILRTSLVIRLWVGLAVLVVGLALSWILSDMLIRDGTGHVPVMLAFVGGFATSIYGHARLHLQTARKFKALATVRIATSACTLAILLVLVFVSILSPSSAMASYVVAPLSAFLLLIMLTNGSEKSETGTKEVRKNLVKFSKWIFVVTMLSAVYLRLDVFFLGESWTQDDVGVYSAAVTLIFPVTQFANSLSTVLLPEVSSMTRRSDIVAYARGSLKYTIPISAVLGVFAISSIPSDIIPWLFGAEYAEAIEPFRYLVFSGIAILIATPIYLMVYPIGKPRVLAEGDAVKLILHAVAYAALVPTMGIIGAAYGNVLAMGIGSVISVALVYRAILGSPDEVVPGS